MRRICKRCGSEDLEAIHTHLQKLDAGIGAPILVITYNCRQCGYWSAYGELEPTRITRSAIRLAEARHNIV